LDLFAVADAAVIFAPASVLSMTKETGTRNAVAMADL
jgi:hypothetical protein